MNPGEHPHPIEIHALMDREAGPADGLRLARHLQDCSRCHGVLARLEALAARASQLPEAESPRGFTEQVMRRVRRMPAPEPSLPPLQLVAPILALMIGGIAAMTSVGTGRVTHGVGRLLRLEFLRPENVYELVLTFATAALGGLGRAFDGLVRLPSLPSLLSADLLTPSFLLLSTAYVALLALMLAALAGRGLLRSRSSK